MGFFFFFDASRVGGVSTGGDDVVAPRVRGLDRTLTASAPQNDSRKSRPLGTGGPTTSVARLSLGSACQERVLGGEGRGRDRLVCRLCWFQDFSSFCFCFKQDRQTDSRDGSSRSRPLRTRACTTPSLLFKKQKTNTPKNKQRPLVTQHLNELPSVPSDI